MHLGDAFPGSDDFLSQDSTRFLVAFFRRQFQRSGDFFLLAVNLVYVSLDFVLLQTQFLGPIANLSLGIGTLAEQTHHHERLPSSSVLL